MHSAFLPARPVFQLLTALASFFRERQISCWLVGGSVRDLLLAQPGDDWDLVVDADALPTARKAAQHINAMAIPMHELACRLVPRDPNVSVTFDLSSLKGPNINADLFARDFTCNALAVPLTDLVEAWEQAASFVCIDPTGGIADIEAGRLAPVSREIFLVHPIRILRAARFATRYHWQPVPELLELAQDSVTQLIEEPAERLHEQFWKMLETPNSDQQLRLLDAMGALAILMPEFEPARGMSQPGMHHYDVFAHSLETVRTMEQVMAALRQEPVEGPHGAYLLEALKPIADLLQRGKEHQIVDLQSWKPALIKMSAFLHDIGKTVTYQQDDQGVITFYGHPQLGIPLAQQVMQRLGASTQEQRIVRQVVSHHMRPGFLSMQPLSKRAVRRFFVELGPVGVLVCLVSLADHLAMRGPLPLEDAWQRHYRTVLELYHIYIDRYESIIPPRLVNGGELIQKFNLTPGPIVSTLLEAIAEAQTEGQVQSKKDAFWFAEEFLSKQEGTNRHQD